MSDSRFGFYLFFSFWALFCVLTYVAASHGNVIATLGAMALGISASESMNRCRT